MNRALGSRGIFFIAATNTSYLSTRTWASVRTILPLDQN